MQLGGTPFNLYDQAKDGVVDVVWTLVGNTPGRMPRTEVFELPFTMSHAEPTSRAMWEYVQTNAADEFKDVQLIATHVHGPGVFHTKDKQINAVADLKGLKMRGPTRLTTNLLKALGATPVGLPLPQIPDALSKGVIDGCVIPWEVVPAVKVQELAKFHSEFDPSLPALYTTTFVLAMNKAKYDSLPAELKKVIDANSGADTSAWLGKVQEGNDPKGRKTAEDRKNTITRLSQAEYESFRKASEQVDDDWVKEMNGKGFNGKQLLESARTLIKKYTK
jgi:TRAP-type C4-dicarboxylate transport system substrate-binding protein